MKVFFALVTRSGAPGDAFALSGVMEWPDDPDNDSPAKWRHELLEDEIVRLTFDEIEEPLRDAFVKAARYVIEREREKDRAKEGTS